MPCWRHAPNAPPVDLRMTASAHWRPLGDPWRETPRAMIDAPPWRRSWRQRAKLSLIAGVGYPLLAGVGSTYRYEVAGGEHVTAAEQMGQPIYACWHGRILGGTIYLRNRDILVITSQNFDGEWIARILSKFGFRTARGSSSRGARSALRQMLREIKHRPVAFTVDGPRGPERVAQPGAVWLSRAAQSPVLPFHVEARRYWTLKSWDRAQIPKPFTHVAVTFAEPFVVPRSADGETLETFRRRLQQDLFACEQRCVEKLIGGG